MGQIKGDVEVLGISNLLQMLSMAGCKGYLTIVLEGQKKVIHFQDDGIRLVSGARRTNPLGEILMRTGKITRDQLDELLAEQRRTATALGEIVSRRGILDPAVIQSALREQVAEEIYDLFTWSGANFFFQEAAGFSAPVDTGPLANVLLDANVMSLMIEAARRVDELARIHSVIPDVRLVAERLELPASLDDPSLDRNSIEDILPLVDGERSVGHIIEESLFPKFTVLRTLYGLAQRGVIKIRDLGEGAVGPHTVLRRPSTPVEERVPTNGRSVMLVSELPTFRQALGLFIRSAGYDVIEGRPADETADFTRRPADVAVIDIPLETEDGLLFCKLLRDKMKVPFIVLAGNTSKQAINNALQCGAKYVLVKPFKEDLLLERISNVLKA
jgi:two-component system chemotaxis response regulator CheY